MLPRFSRLTPFLALAAIIIASEICGSTTSTAGGPRSSPTPTITPDPGHFIVVNQTATSTIDDIALHLIGLDYDFSPPAPMPTLGATCGSLLVFTSANPPSISGDSAKQMRSYLMALPSGNGIPYPSPASAPPPGMNWIPAGSTCHLRLEISNVSGQGGQAGRDMTINGLDLRLATSPLPVSHATTTYSLVDTCSVVSGVICGYPSAAPDDVYVATIQLGAGDAGTTFPGTVTVGEVDPTLYPLPPFILQAGQTRDIDLTVSVPDGTAFAYQVVPDLLVNDGGVRTLTYTSLSTHLAFAPTPANWQKWPCFGFVNNTDGSVSIVPDAQVKYNRASEHGYCYSAAVPLGQ